MKQILPIIVFAQFFCTSLWFAGNSVISDLVMQLDLDSMYLAHLTSAIQFGFISGTLVFSIFAISDRVSPSVVFFVSSILAAIFNLGTTLKHLEGVDILLFRFLTGFFLAGIYPVGMKIASDYFKEGLGRALGYLVGALVLGTAFPHFIKVMTLGFPWEYVIYATSSLSVLGGMSIIFFVPDGPYRKQGQKLKLTSFLNGFKQRYFRNISLGYFGHMWELYAFWAFVPLMLNTYNQYYPNADLNVSLFSFLIIASGSVSCVIGGILSKKFGARNIASISLLLSCSCCLVSPFFLLNDSPSLLIVFLLFWGLVVIADSPLFSTLVAQNAPEESRGTSLTIVNCIGFSITIISIQVINLFSSIIDAQYIYTLLAIGPIIGLIAIMYRPTNQMLNDSQSSLKSSNQ